jgi:hypothetical protein
VSYDLHVVPAQQGRSFSSVDVQAFLRKQPHVEQNGPAPYSFLYSGEDGSAFVTLTLAKVLDERQGSVGSLDRVDRVEVNITRDYHMDRTRADVVRLCSRLARAIGGAIYDCQIDQIIPLEAGP